MEGKGTREQQRRHALSLCISMADTCIYSSINYLEHIYVSTIYIHLSIYVSKVYLLIFLVSFPHFLCISLSIFWGHSLLSTNIQREKRNHHDPIENPAARKNVFLSPCACFRFGCVSNPSESSLEPSSSSYKYARDADFSNSPLSEISWRSNDDVGNSRKNI